jgi:hypothetical protein
MEPTKIKKIDLNIPNKLAFVLENAVSADYCKDLIKLSEEGGYKVATLSYENGIEVEQPETRDCFRHIR